MIAPCANIHVHMNSQALMPDAIVPANGMQYCMNEKFPDTMDSNPVHSATLKQLECHTNEAAKKGREQTR